MNDSFINLAVKIIGRSQKEKFISTIFAIPTWNAVMETF